MSRGERRTHRNDPQLTVSELTLVPCCDACSVRHCHGCGTEAKCNGPYGWLQSGAPTRRHADTPASPSENARRRVPGTSRCFAQPWSGRRACRWGDAPRRLVSGVPIPRFPGLDGSTCRWVTHDDDDDRPHCEAACSSFDCHRRVCQRRNHPIFQSNCAAASLNPQHQKPSFGWAMEPCRVRTIRSILNISS